MRIPLSRTKDYRHCEAGSAEAIAEKRDCFVGALRLLAMTVSAIILLALPAWANNVKVSNVVLDATLANKSTQTIPIKFDLSQDNAFGDLTDANSAAYSDYIWIFVKYYIGSSYDGNGYLHAKLQSTGSDAVFTVTSDGVGALIKASDAKAGLTLVWDYGHNIGGAASSVTTSSVLNLKVFAIEMVKIPQGSFYIGDGTAISSDTFSHFFNANSTSGAALQITSADLPYISNKSDGTGTAGDIAWAPTTYSGALPTSRTQLPAGYPTGFNSFYIMKYEVSQGQYRDFLNTLSRAQQVNRVATNIASGTTSVTNVFVMANTNVAPNINSTSNYRNGIACASTIPATTPVTFFCDYNANGTGNETDDGAWIACSYTSWLDLCAYADWAGLRPMTELEFEKAARGPLSAVQQEYAWGSTDLTKVTGISNAGTNTETSSNSGLGISVCDSQANVKGPLRVGFGGPLATSSDNSRKQSGASYYGVMELSGNLWECPVSVMSSQSGTTVSIFTGTHGDGTLSSDGYASGSSGVNIYDWPGYTEGKVTVVSAYVGAGTRGSNWYNDPTVSRVSNRWAASSTAPYRDYGVNGLRCVRTSP